MAIPLFIATEGNHDFRGLYAVILFVVTAAREPFGDEALDAVAFISELIDVNAIPTDLATQKSSA